MEQYFLGKEPLHYLFNFSVRFGPSEIKIEYENIGKEKPYEELLGWVCEEVVVHLNVLLYWMP